MSAPTIYRFQYGATPAYGSQTPMSEPIGEDETGHAVSQPVTDLQPGITYHFRVVAVNYNGVAPGPDEVFNTPDAPVVLDDGVSAITQTTATLHANVKPGFSPTTVRFEYGPTLSYGQSVGGQAGSDNQLHGVSTPVSGLSPGTTYHVRVIAENAIDQALGPEVTFTTASPEVVQPKTPKPACRRGFARRHGRCVRRRRRGKHHHHHHHHRHEHRGGHRGRSNGHG
jgi:phosphodiesterase/alkaline phosphatase D-like protein